MLLKEADEIRNIIISQLLRYLAYGVGGSEKLAFTLQ